MVAHDRPHIANRAQRSMATAGGRLTEEVSDVDIEKIASKYLTDWEKLRPSLGLTKAQETQICKSSPGDYEKQKRDFLYKWKEVKGSGATYGALKVAAEKTENKQLADNVMTMLQEKLDLSSSPKVVASKVTRISTWSVCSLSAYVN